MVGASLLSVFLLLRHRGGVSLTIPRCTVVITHSTRVVTASMAWHNLPRHLMLYLTAGHQPFYSVNARVSERAGRAATT